MQTYALFFFSHFVNFHQMFYKLSAYYADYQHISFCYHLFLGFKLFWKRVFECFAVGALVGVNHILCFGVHFFSKPRR